MSIFGVGFRILLVALAVLVERIGGFLREHPLLSRLLASEPPGAIDEDVF